MLGQYNLIREQPFYFFFWGGGCKNIGAPTLAGKKYLSRGPMKINRARICGIRYFDTPTPRKSNLGLHYQLYLSPPPTHTLRDEISIKKI